MKRTSDAGDKRRATLLMCVCVGTLSAMGILTGCKDRKIETYEIAKESMPAAIETADHAAHAQAAAPPGVTTETTGSLSWEAPPHWKPKPVSAMRRASFGVPLADGTEADLSVSVLGGAAGGLAANVNRWRAQLGLPELAADEIPRAAEKVPAGGVTFTLFDLAGNPGGAEVRMLAAVAEFEGQSWFVKLMGHDHCVATEKPAFVAFLRSIKTP
ncbi:MAG: hypothetical protein ACOZE5_14715 [Verrucomicrobiota bacterium]